MDEVVTDVEARYPELEVVGLPITGRVLRLAQFLEARREQRLAEFGLSVADFDVLATLLRRAGTGAVNVRDLQHAMMLSSSGVTKRLDRMEAASLVKRLPDPSDRRGVLITLTPGGLRLIDEVVPVITEFESQLVRSALGSQKERQQVEVGLRRLLVAQETQEATDAHRAAAASSIVS
jgi:DNA-binding MarR family transcriptional regulator